MRCIFFFLGIQLFLFYGCKEDPAPTETETLPDNYVKAIYVSDDGVKYFATNRGLASFDGLIWTVYHSNPKITSQVINDISFEENSYGEELWLGTNNGVTVATLPIDAVSGATTYTAGNTQTLFPEDPNLAGDSVLVVATDEKNIRWFGTNGGLSTFHGNQFPDIDYLSFYSPGFFEQNRITSFSSTGDTMFIGTIGGGVARIVSSSPDAITAASPYEIPWSALPSNNILSVFTDGTTQWYGTDEGLARHTGFQAKMNWESFYQQDGLVNNRVQCIGKDSGGNMWFGTPAGVTKFDGSSWESYTTSEGLVSNNVLCIAVDTGGSMWFGTDNGISHFDGDSWVSYRAE